jgi:hypothetical protein
LNLEELLKQVDSYSRTARLYPAMLAVAPAVWTALSLHPRLVSDGAGQLIVTGIGFAGGTTLLAALARALGKRVEDRLIAAWGGWRTTVVLRHRDHTIDLYTKRRYHERLNALCDGLVLPGPEEEAHNWEDADARYRSATRRLIEVRRDSKYRVLHRENALYGFRRNLFGLKPVAILTILLSLALCVLVWLHGGSSPPSNGRGLLEDASTRWPVYAASIANVAYLLFWLLIVRKSFVRQAADEYAVALFGTLE